MSGLDWPRPKEGITTVGVIGWPVAHSLSPPIQNAAFRELGMDWEYVRLPLPPGKMPDAIRELIDGFRGANVTMPHKLDAFQLSAMSSPDATRLHAVNTLTVEGGEVSGENTDAPGFANFLRDDVAFDPEGTTALLYGGGGAARACALALANAGVARLIVAVRKPGAWDVVRAVGGMPVEIEAVAFDEAATAGKGAALIVNATPLGMSGETLPLPPLSAASVVVDLIYHPDVTPMLETARAAGARTFGGVGMLVHQAGLSFELWTGKPAPWEIMREAAATAVGS
jgi:shikimate dehydrogenase